MSEYGFEYFLERAETLNEMARPVSVFTTIDPELAPIQDTYIKLMNSVGPLVGKDTGKRQFFVYAYLLSTLMHHIDPDLDMDVGKFASEITGRQQRDFNTMKAAFLKAAQQHKDIVNSPDFAQEALDDNNVNQFHTTRETIGGARRTGFKNEVQNTLGTSAEDFQDVQNQAGPIVSTLNKLMHGRKVSRAQKGDASKYAGMQQGSALPSDASPNIDFAHSIVDAIDTLLEDQAETQSALQSGQLDVDDFDRRSKILAASKTAKGDLGVLKQMYSKMADEGTGTTPDEFEAQIQKLSSLKGMTPDRALIFALLQDELAEASEFSASLRDAQHAHGNTGKSYDGYDPDILGKVLDTPEKAELFDKWFTMNQQWRAAKNEKLEQLWMRQLMQTNFFDRKGIEDDPTQKFMSADVQALLNQQHRIQQALDNEHRPDKIEAFKKQLQHIGQQIKFKRGEVPQEPQEEEEGGVMGYMTEQVSRDGYNVKKVGKFVERGYKRPVNYAHWLHINR